MQALKIFSSTCQVHGDRPFSVSAANKRRVVDSYCQLSRNVMTNNNDDDTDDDDDDDDCLFVL